MKIRASILLLRQHQHQYLSKKLLVLNQVAEPPVGKVTRAQLEEIAKIKDPDLTAADMDAAVRTLSGSARSAGIEVEG